MISELKAFLMRGEVISVAVALIIAGSFQKIIDSLVADIIMPVVGAVAGTPDFSSIKIGPIGLGNFLNAVINFIIIGTALFFIVKAAGKNTADVK